MQVSNFDDASEVLITLRITTRRLYLMAYSSYQKWLLDRVVELREGQSLTFQAIAMQLSAKKILSPRGQLLTAENVFSIYKKGRLRQSRLTEDARCEILDLRCR